MHPEEIARKREHLTKLEIKFVRKQKPKPWNFALRCFFLGKMTGYRKREVEREYCKAKCENKKVWKNIESQVKSEVFKMKPDKNTYSGLLQVLEPIEGMFVVLRLLKKFLNL